MRKINKGNLELIDSYLTNNDWRIKESACSNYSMQGLSQHISSTIISQYWLNNIYDEKTRNAHLDGFIHIHDLGFLAPYCAGWDLKDLLTKGLRGPDSKISSKPPQHFRSACIQVGNALQILQGEFSGAQSFSNFDTLLAPFIRKDHLTYSEVKQSIQELIYNLNLPARVGFQSPFTNFSFDLNPRMFKDDQVIPEIPEFIGLTYSDFQPEMDMINKAFCEVMIEGDARGSLFSFPIPTYNINKSFDWDSEIANCIFEMTAKYGIPYFSNFINSELSEADSRSMCCRLRLDLSQIQKRNGGLFGSTGLTGSIGVVTLNLPRMGYLSKTEEELFSMIDIYANIAKESLLLKRKYLESLMDSDLFPYSKIFLEDIYEKNNHRYWENHFSTIGLVGMNECLLNFIHESIETKNGHELAQKILQHLKSLTLEFQKETGRLFNLEATPAEGTSYRLAKLDKKQFPDIISASISSTPFYTNSSQLPVDSDFNLLEAMRHQDKLQTLYTGGTVFHTNLNEQNLSPESAKNIIRKIFTNFSIPYLTITPTFSICPDDGYIPGEVPTCPHCGKSTQIYSRIVGYIRPISCWNDGKTQEFKQRNNFSNGRNSINSLNV